MKTKNIVLILIISAMFVACSKFEDGPAISFRSVYKRFTGEYRVTQITKNDTDLTDYWNQHYDLTFDFHRNEDYRAEEKMYANIYGKVDSCGKWKIHGKTYPFTLEVNKDVRFFYMNPLYTTNFSNQGFYPLVMDTSMHLSETVIFIVTRLKDTEMWVKHTTGNDTYEIHFKE